VFCFWTPREGGATAHGPGRDSQTRGQGCWVHQTATSCLSASNRRRSEHCSSSGWPKPKEKRLAASRWHNQLPKVILGGHFGCIQCCGRRDPRGRMGNYSRADARRCCPHLSPTRANPGQLARGIQHAKWGITQPMNDDKARAPCGFGQPKVAELRGRTCSSPSFYRLRLDR
jgi:hypothetical protein